MGTRKKRIDRNKLPRQITYIQKFLDILVLSVKKELIEKNCFLQLASSFKILNELVSQIHTVLKQRGRIYKKKLGFYRWGNLIAMGLF